MSKVQLCTAEQFACPSCRSQRRQHSPICLGAPPRHSGPSLQSPPIKPIASSGPGYAEPPRNTGAETRLWQGSLPQTGFFSTHELSGCSSLSQLRAALGSVSHLSSACTPFPLAVTSQTASRGRGPESPRSCLCPGSSLPALQQGSKSARAARHHRWPHPCEPRLAQHSCPCVTEDLPPTAGSATSLHQTRAAEP